MWQRLSKAKGKGQRAKGRNFLLGFFSLTINLLPLAISPAFASTIILDGNMDTVAEVEQSQSFSVPQTGLKKLVFKFASPTSFETKTAKQDIKNYNLTYNPKPDSAEALEDNFGNKFTVVTWNNLKTDALVVGRFQSDLKINLKEVSSAAPFPLKDIPEKEKRFLAFTSLTQDANQIKELAQKLTRGANTEQDAVNMVLNWVVDNIRYTTNPPQYDAVYTFETKKGNCQNFSHISIALLRSVGIPARIVGGITLKKAWKIPLKNGTLIQDIGQGGHAWLEVFFPDLGWISYDAQQSHLFVSPRHIKQTIGLDANDINDSWKASPSLPAFDETIGANFITDSIKLSLKDTREEPSNYILTNALTAHKISPPAKEIKKPEEKPLPEKKPEEPKIAEKPKPVEPKKPEKPKAPKYVEFGNLDFPELIGLFQHGKDKLEGFKTLDKETAEYVTSEYTYAQAFAIDKPLKIEEISLAMHKFGGRAGSLWIDVVKDNNGKPGMEGIRSYPLNLDEIKYTAGYKWFPFKFKGAGVDAPQIEKGRYWIVLRRSKDTIVNWFYIPGNPFGDADDTRSTEKGIDWMNILNYDFNFKAAGYFVE
ncbi:MAG: transglutaminase domain-containing protein [Deltaproteobacteria bacterium]|nr:transglutaminase domain-containing protein [Deltaproteobacteria bacterium]